MMPSNLIYLENKNQYKNVNENNQDLLPNCILHFDGIKLIGSNLKREL